MRAGVRARIGIWGVFGRGNFGNEATLTAMIARLDPLRFDPVAVSEDPRDTAARHGIRAVRNAPPATGGTPIGLLANRLRFLLHAVRLCRRFDAVVVPGMGGLEEPAPFGTPFEMWCFALAARMHRTPFVLIDVGVGAPASRLTRLFVRGVGRSATARSFRDAESRAHMTAVGVPAASDAVVTDMALGLSLDRAPREGRLIAFGVMEYAGDGRTGGDRPETLETYIDRCAAAIDHLTAAEYRVVLVRGDLSDDETAQRIARRATGPVEVSPADDAASLVQLLSRADAVVASRYHTLVFALLAGTPVISLGYNFKSAALHRQLGFVGDAFDAGGFDPEGLARRIVIAAEDRDGPARVDEALSRARDRLDDAWPAQLTTLSRPHGRRA